MTTPNQAPTPNSQNLAHILERYATWLFASVIVIVSALLFYVGLQVLPAYKETFIAIATSLLASLIFALVYSFVVENHRQRVVNDQLSQSVRTALDAMTQVQEANMQRITDITLAKIEEIEQTHYREITLHFRELIPSDYFPPTNQPDKRFNDSLGNTLTRSGQYLFKGVTGRYIPSRLAMLNRYNLTCKILLVNPQNEDLLQLYVRDRFGVNLSVREMTDQVLKVKREIYMTVIDLFDQARKIALDIRIYEGPIFYRTEIFDEQVFTSYFTAKTSTAFPTTYVYNKESFFYDAFVTDFNQTFELSHISATFNSRSTDTNLHNLLMKVGCDLNEVSNLREEARAFREAFLNRA